MKLATHLRTALIAHLIAQTAKIEVIKAAAASVDAFGLSAFEREQYTIHHHSQGNSVRHFWVPILVTRSGKPYNECYDYLVTLDRGRDSDVAHLNLPPLCAVYIEDTSVNFEDNLEAFVNLPWIVPHGGKGKLLDVHGTIGDFSLRQRTVWRPATEAEINELVDGLTEYQIKTILKSDYFTDILIAANTEEIEPVLGTVG